MAVAHYDVKRFDGAVLALQRRRGGDGVDGNFDSNAEEDEEVTYEMGDFLGGGAAANVYAATEEETGQVRGGGQLAQWR